MNKRLIFVVLGVLLLFSVNFFYREKHLLFIGGSPTPTNIALPSYAPTPTLAPGQKAIYTFYIQTTSHKSSQVIVLTPSDTGRTLKVDTGTLIILEHFVAGNSHLSTTSPQEIFRNNGPIKTIHLPQDSIGSFKAFRPGFGTITVTEILDNNAK